MQKVVLLVQPLSVEKRAEMPGMYGSMIMIWLGFKVGVAGTKSLTVQKVAWRGWFWLASRYPLNAILTCSSLRDYISEEVLPDLKGRKLVRRVLLSQLVSTSKQHCHSSKKNRSDLNATTGGGFIENVLYWMFSDDLAAEIDESKVPVLPPFKALENMAKLNMKKCLKSSTWGLSPCLQWNQKMWNVSKNFWRTLLLWNRSIVKKNGASVCDW